MREREGGREGRRQREKEIERGGDEREREREGGKKAERERDREGWG